MIGSALRTHLLASPAVAAITTAIQPQVLDNPLAGGITYRVAADEDEMLLDGDQSSLEEALIEIDCWDLDYMRVQALADAVEISLISYVGLFGELGVDHCRVERRFDLFETDTRLHRVQMQFFMSYYDLEE